MELPKTGNLVRDRVQEFRTVPRVVTTTQIRPILTYYPRQEKGCHLCGRTIPARDDCYRLTSQGIHAHKDCWELALERERIENLDATCEVSFELARFPNTEVAHG